MVETAWPISWRVPSWLWQILALSTIINLRPNVVCLFWLVYIFWIQETIERVWSKWRKCLLISPKKAQVVFQWREGPLTHQGYKLMLHLKQWFPSVGQHCMGHVKSSASGPQPNSFSVWKAGARRHGAKYLLLKSSSRSYWWWSGCHYSVCGRTMLRMLNSDKYLV